MKQVFIVPSLGSLASPIVKIERTSDFVCDESALVHWSSCNKIITSSFEGR